MKKTYYLTIVVALLMVACQQTPKTVPVDTNAEKAAITALFDKFTSALNVKDVKTLTTLLTDDALGCGTDPSEFWNKKQLSDTWTQQFADTSFTINWTIDKREIRVAAEGKSAIIVEQYILPDILSPKITIRNIYLAKKANENWMIDFISWNIVLKNEDIPNLNKAME